MADISLLDLNQRVTSDVYNRIERAMTTQLETQQRAGEFVVGMNVKAAQHAETQRMNDASIMQMKETNYLNARRLEMDQELAPLRIQSENLRMAAAMFGLQKQKEAANSQLFGTITANFDEQVGYDVLKSGSVDQAKEYLALKSKWQGIVGNGYQFDTGAFQKEVDKIRGKYSGVTPDEKEWSIETRYLLQNISPALGEAYDKRNPVLKQNKNGLVPSYYNMPDTQVGKFAQEYAGMYDPEEWGKINIGRRVAQNNKSIIEAASREADRLNRELVGINEKESPIHYKQVKDEADRNMKRAQEAFEQNAKMDMNAAMGIYGVPVDFTPIKATPEPKGEDISDVKMPPISKTGVKPADVNDKRGTAMMQNILQLESVITGSGPKEGTELQEIDFDYWNQFRQDGPMNDDTKSRIKDRALTGIEKNNITEDGLSRDKVEAILASIDKKVEIPINKGAVEILGNKLGIGAGYPIQRNSKAKDMLFDMSPDVPHTIAFGPKTPDSMGAKVASHLTGNSQKIESFDDIQKLLAGIQNKYERRAVQDEIYAALIAAASVSILEKTP